MPSAPTLQQPLATLLSEALVAFTIEFDNLAEERITAAGPRPWIASQAMWVNHLRFVGDDGIAADELMRRSLVSPATIRSRLGALRRWRYVTVDSADVVHLTAAGRRARDVWRPLAGQVEARWSARHRDPAVAGLRAALNAAVSVDKLSLPTHVDGLQVLGADPTRVRDLARLSGCSKEGMAMIPGFLARAGLATVEPDPAGRGKVVRLTARGLAAKGRGVARVAALDDAIGIRNGWQLPLRAALDTVLESPAFAEGVKPPPSGWRARPPYLAQTERLLADPRGALPRHPLVLHRGGYPDGS